MRLKISFVALFSLCAVSTYAQYRASIQGVVADPQGAVIVGAKVTVTAKDTGLTQEASTDQDGIYTVNRLAPGLYTIAVESPGFQKKVIDSFNILAEQGNSLNVTLQIGQVAQSITVNGNDLPAIDTETGQISGTLSSKEVQNLPSFGRDPFQLLRLAPGVFGDGALNNGGNSQNVPGSAGPGGPNQFNGLSIFPVENQAQTFANGQRNEGNSFQVDGVSVNSLDWGGAAVITPNEESVKEVKITSNSYDAEYGRSNGAQIEVVSQSGTNQYHGSIFIKMDRPGLNSFQGYNGPGGAGALQRVTSRFNQIGGSAGGPILKNRLFVFFSYETLRNNSVTTGTNWVETPQFIAANKGRSSGFISSVYANFPGEGPSFSTVIPITCAQANFPAANCQTVTGGLDIGSPLTSARGTKDPTFGAAGTPFGVGNGLDGIPDIQFVQTTDPTNSVATQWNGRADYQVTSKDLVTYSIYWVPNNITNFNGLPRAANLYHSDHISYAEALLWNRTLSPTMINEARFNVSRWYWNELESNPQEPWGLPLDTLTGLPNGVNQITFGAPGPSILYKTGYNVRDTLRKALGKHSLKFGVDIYLDQNTQTQANSARPTYNFNDIWDFTNDAPVSEGGQFNPTTGVPTSYSFYGRHNDYSFFGQDDYKFRPNLTFNFGLRWEYFSPFHEKHNNLAVVVLGAPPNQLTGLKQRLGGDLYTASKRNWGPQLGFAWSPTRVMNHEFNNKLVLRGGLGIGYDRMEDAIPDNALFNPNPFSAGFNFVGSNIVYAVPSNPRTFSPYPANPNAKITFDPTTNLPAGASSLSLNAFPANLATPLTYRYSLEAQYDLGHDWIATVGYTGNTTHHLLRWVFQGQILFSPQNPVTNNLRYFVDDVNANYNALLTQLQKRFSHSFELDVQYSYGKSMDDASTNFYFDQYPFTPQAAWGPSDFDATHNFKLWGVWSPRIFSASSWKEKALGGWSFSGILNAHSGFPWTPFYGVQVTGTPSGNQCSLLFDNSGYCNVRPAAYLGGALSSHSNAILERQLGQFPNGPNSYFTPPNLSVNGIPPVPGVGRNSFRGPRYSSVDFTLSKAFGLPNAKIIGEGAKLELRLNFYNLLNQTNLAPIGNQFLGNIQLNSVTGVQTNPTVTTFDQACCGLAGRVIEAQIRFSF